MNNKIRLLLVDPLSVVDPYHTAADTACRKGTWSSATTWWN